MRLVELNATSHASGNRIDLSWKIPELAAYPSVRVVRRETTHPIAPDDGVVVAEGTGIEFASDTGVQAGRNYYYMLFPFRDGPREYSVDRHNRADALATAPEDFAGYMYGLLPAVYHRYDTNLPLEVPPTMSATDIERGQLRRFLDLPGGQLDQVHGFAKSVLDLHDIQRANGNLLPLLAQWIGWRTDHTLELKDQRNEIRDATSLYRTIGMVPTVEAAVKRITGWETRTKEFVNNVFLSQQPERLNLWSQVRDTGGSWRADVEPLSLDFAYEGRAALTEDDDGIRWLFYHTRRKDRWEIWYKSSPTVELEPRLQEQLVAGPASARLIQAFTEAGLSLTTDGLVTTVGSLWHIDDVGTGDSYVAQAGIDRTTVFHTSAPVPRMAPSQPLSSSELVQKHPVAALQQGILWVFWNSYDSVNKVWQIHFRTRTDGQWSQTWSPENPPPADHPFGPGPAIDAGPGRKAPSVTVDGGGGLWLSWLENDGSGWRLRYNRHDGSAWGTALDFPDDGGQAPGTLTDSTILADPVTTRLYVFWSRSVPLGPAGQTRWEIAYRFKSDLALDQANWSAIQVLAKAPIDADFHDREPAPVLTSAGLELFWSSNRAAHGWSVWHAVPTDITTNTWAAAERVTEGTYSQRAPALLPVGAGDELWMTHRSNRRLDHMSGVYRATESVDDRYAGSTTIDTRHADKHALRASFDDFQTYTYDVGASDGPGDDDWYARDTVGLYLEPDTLDEDAIEAGKQRLAPVLEEFLPATDRAVFIPRSTLVLERVYSYGLPPSSEMRVIGEEHVDELNAVLLENLFGPDEDFLDELES